jgi:nicotinamidase/pyrazinamidase
MENQRGVCQTMAVEYDEKTCLLIVDVQNDFAHVDGSLYVKGGEAVVPVINAEIEKAQAAGALIVYSQDWHPETTRHFAKDGGIWPVHCVGGSWGSRFHRDLVVVEGREVIRKGTGGEDGYSVFSVRDPQSGATFSTELESILRSRDIQRLVIVGLATDYCVKETALDARRQGFEVGVVKKGIGAVDLQAGDGERALAAVVAAGGRVE